jgi:hypothetical protein
LQAGAHDNLIKQWIRMAEQRGTALPHCALQQGQPPPPALLESDGLKRWGVQLNCVA